jgi:hypothetical protein
MKLDDELIASTRLLRERALGFGALFHKLARGGSGRVVEAGGLVNCAFFGCRLSQNEGNSEYCCQGEETRCG